MHFVQSILRRELCVMYQRSILLQSIGCRDSKLLGCTDRRVVMQAWTTRLEATVHGVPDGKVVVEKTLEP